MRVVTYALTLDEVPVDLFADPDGEWTYETLVARAGLDPDAVPLAVIGALAAPWRGHPDGAAVVASAALGTSAVTIVECDDPAAHVGHAA